MQSTNKELFFSKGDTTDLRFGDFVTERTQEADILIMGYPDDRGVANNGGRIGAAQGPDAIRKIFYKMTRSFDSENNMKICDLGNIQTGKSIAEDHEFAVKFLKNNYVTKNQRLICLGGGHDYSYPDGKLFLEHQNHDEKPIIINFDAHLDCRPYTDQVNSGTPFYRLLENYPGQFHFFEIGLQKQCNSKKHFQWAKQKGLKALWLEDIYHSKEDIELTLKSFFAESLNLKTKVYLSIDMDVFSSAYAPGCSQSWPTGLDPHFVYRAMEMIFHHWDVPQLGIYETSPKYDLDDRTSRLAAKLMHQYIENYI